MAQSEEFIFPGWEVTRKLGEGSFGGVYEIRRTLPGGRVEKCALKRLTVPRDGEEIRELYAQSFSKDSITAHYKGQMGELVNEYSLMQSLSGCPNIVNCHDIQYIQHDDGIGWDIFIRMELLYPLKKALSSSYSEETTVALGMQLCNALNACHGENIIHRDIKPENILVSGKGVFKLGDFGVAKISERTGTGTLTGTGGYMAPEVANRQHYGTSADIYSLGMVLYWMMNRRTLPFLPLPPNIPTGVQRQQAQDRRLSGDPLPPPADGSEALKQVVLKACAFSPAERYRSAEEMRQALQDCLRAPAAPQKPQQEPTASPASVSEPTILDTPTELEREPAIPKNDLRQQQEEKKAPVQKQKKPVIRRILTAAIIVALLGSCGIGILISGHAGAQKQEAYQAAQTLMDNAAYQEAAEAFEALGSYNDSAEMAKEARNQLSLLESYQIAQASLDQGEYEAAAQQFEALGDYRDSAEKAQEALELLELQEREQAYQQSQLESYQAAQALLEQEDYPAAAEAFEALGNYRDSAEKAKEARGLQERKESQRVLREDSASADYLGDGDWVYPAVFGSDITRDEVTAIVFRDTTQNAPEDAWDVSKNADRSVLAWTSGSQGYYTLIIAAQGSVIAPRNCLMMFADYPNVTSIQFNGVFDTSKAADMYGMFTGCKNLTSLDLSSFDTSNVEDMGSMFDGCGNLASLDVSGFDTSHVTNMCAMFDSCESLTSLDLSSFDTSNVTYMNCMFFYCKKLASLDVSSFDTSKVTSMALMFTNCESLTMLDLSNFNTSKVEDMGLMFNGCGNLTSLDLSSFDTSNVTDMHSMFDGCKNLDWLDLSSFDTSKVTDMQGMFNGCKKLSYLDLSNFNTSNVTDMSWMFRNCDSLTYLGLGQFDTSSVTHYDYFMDNNVTCDGSPWQELFE